MGETQRIGIRELRQHASRYIDEAAHGQAIDVTRHGRIVARIVPAAPENDRLAELVAAGIIEPAEESGSLLDIEPLPPEPGKPLPSEILQEMRDEER